jgi:hypothetical protein
MGLETPNLGLYKASFGETGYFEHIDDNWDILDSLVATLQDNGRDEIRYCKPDGDNADDGLSWATAKLDVLGAYDALPTTGGTIYVATNTYIDALHTTRGLWMAGPADPNYASLPAGWRQAKAIKLIGATFDTNKAGVFYRQAAVLGGDPNDRDKPVIWHSSFGNPMLFKDLHLGTPNVAVRIGIDSNGQNAGVAAGISSSVVFQGCGSNNSGKRAGGPTVEIGYIIWCYWRSCAFDGNNAPYTPTAASINAGTTARFTIGAGHALIPGDVVYVSGMTASGYNGTWTVTAVGATTFDADIGSSPGAATVMGSVIPLLHRRRGPFSHYATTGEANAGLFTIENAVTYGGGVYYHPNSSGGSYGGVRIIDLTQEGDNTANPQPPLFHLVKDYGDTNLEGTGFGFIVDTCGQADGTFPYDAVLVDGDDFDGITVINTAGQGPQLVTPGDPGVSDRRRQVGWGNRRLYGEWDGQGRGFGPAAVPFTNYAPHNPASWTATGGATLTTGQVDPIGGTGAGKILKASGSDEHYIINVSTGPVGVGDWFIGGASYHRGSPWPIRSPNLVARVRSMVPRCRWRLHHRHRHRQLDQRGLLRPRRPPRRHHAGVHRDDVGRHDRAAAIGLDDGQAVASLRIDDEDVSFVDDETFNAYSTPTPTPASRSARVRRLGRAVPRARRRALTTRCGASSSRPRCRGRRARAAACGPSARWSTTRSTARCRRAASSAAPPPSSRPTNRACPSRRWARTARSPARSRSRRS